MSAAANITFVNHASVVVSDGKTSLLTDPWYSGTAFHDGWKLITETPDDTVGELLDKINFIWISHEHPDHFQIGFFKKFSQKIKDRSIKIIFQRTKDQRVVSFLRANKFDVIELDDKEWFTLSDGFSVSVVKSDFYDSAIVMKVGGKTIFNLNDCPIHSDSELRQFKKDFGACDVLLTQFSYAAWKGGKDNIAWRTTAAKEKIDAVVNQSNILGAKAVIPFASFIWYSNTYNYYMNDAANTPDDVIEAQSRTSADIVFLAPGETQILETLAQNPDTIEYWRKEFAEIKNMKPQSYSNSHDFSDLSDKFNKYQERIFKKNSRWMVRSIARVKPLRAFQPLNIRLEDTGETVCIDPAKGNFTKTDAVPDVRMHSDSLSFILVNDFGFDTLTVNGCFEEQARGGFSKMAKSLAIGNLNNLGITLTPRIMLNVGVIANFARQLANVAKNID